MLSGLVYEPVRYVGVYGGTNTCSFREWKSMFVKYINMFSCSTVTGKTSSVVGNGSLFIIA